MEGQPTCGQGLAEHSVLPAKLGELVAALAENLEVHMRALDPKDPNARQEYDAYVRLATEHREIADRLQATAELMAGYRDLPMGGHDEQALADSRVLAAFEKFVRAKQELVALLQKMAQQDQEMLAAMRGASGAA